MVWGEGVLWGGVEGDRWKKKRKREQRYERGIGSKPRFPNNDNNIIIVVIITQRRQKIP